MARYSQTAAKLLPHLLQEMSQAEPVIISQAGSGGALVAHALDGAYHTGTLATSQAPWAVTTTAFGIHEANTEAHHATATAGNGISVTGQQISLAATVAGAGLTHSAGVLAVGAGTLLTVAADTVGVSPGSAYQFIGTGSDTGAEWRNVSELAGSGLTAATGVLAVGAGNGLTVAADSVALTTPGTLAVNSSNNAAGSHTHAIASSSSPGPAASILASNSSGGLQLDGELLLYKNDTGSPALHFRNNLGWDTYLWQDYSLFTIDANSLARALTIDSTGIVTLANRLSTPLIVADSHLTLTPTDDLVLSPGSNLAKLASGKTFQSDGYVSQLTGMRVTHDGQADFRYLFVDELHAKAFIADLEQALAGGQIIGKSVTQLGANFTVPAAGATATLTVRDLPSAENMAVFQSGDIVRLRVFSRAGGSLTIADCWGAVTNYADQANKLQTWTFTRSAAPNAGAVAAGTVIATDAIVLDYGTSGNGYHEVNAIDGLYGANSPYSQIVTWTGHPATGQTLRTRMGNLYGLFAVSGEYGLYAGNGTSNNDGYLRISSNSVRLNNIPLTLYNSGTQKVNISATGTDVWIGASSSDKRLSWDGTTLTVKGAIVVQSGSGIGSFSDANLDNIDDGSTYGRINGTIISGGYIRVGSGTKDSTLDGFHISATEIVGQLDGVDQVVMGTDGAILAGAGNVYMNATGVTARTTQTFNNTSSTYPEVPDYADLTTGTKLRFVDQARSVWYGGSNYATYVGGEIAALSVATTINADPLFPNSWGTTHSAFLRLVDSPPKAAASGYPSAWLATKIGIKYGDYELGLLNTTPYYNDGTADRTLWHAGNDGASSGLDADLLDGVQESDLGRLAVERTWTARQIYSVANGNTTVSMRASSGRLNFLPYYSSGALIQATNADGSSLGELTLQGNPTILPQNTIIAGTSVLYSAALTVNGNIHATGVVTSEEYIQIEQRSGAPAAASVYGRIYVDSTDGDLKIIFGNGTVKTIATN